MKRGIKQLTLFLCTLIFLGNISLASADTVSDTDTVFNWAENNYPQYFPTHQTTQSFESWLFRFYSDTDIYVGVDTSDNGVYVFGGPWGNANPTYIDSLSNLLAIQAGQNGKLTDVIPSSDRPTLVLPALLLKKTERCGHGVLIHRVS